MIRFVLALLVCMAAPVWGAPTNIFINNGSLTNAQVIAAEFVNNGYFEVQNLLGASTNASLLSLSTVPYDMTGVRRYYNNGTMVGTSIRLETVDNFANRTPALSFTNTSSGRIDFADGYHFGTFPIFQDFIRGVWSSPFSFLRVDASTIVNQGLMRIGAGGSMRIGQTNQATGDFNADLVDLSSGLLVVDPVGNAYGTPLLTTYDNIESATSYLNDLGVTDIAWGMGTFTNQNQSTFVTSQGVLVPQHRLTNSFGTAFIGSFFLDNPQSFAFTNVVNGTNILVQAVYVQTADTNVIPDVRWYPVAYYFSDIVSDLNTFWTPIVQLRSITTNALTLQTEENAFYIADQFGAETNFTIIQNDRYPQYFRPYNFFVTRSQPIEFESGVTSNFVVKPSDYYPGFSNIVVTNAYSAYVFDIENLVYNVPGVPGASVYDLPGRVEVRGKSVNLNNTGIRGEGLISVQTDNLMGTTNTVIDAQNLAFKLTASGTTPTVPLKIENLAKDKVARLQGQVRLWSGTFTNQFGVVQGTNTNVFNVLYQVTVVDARAVNSVQDVTVSDFQAFADNLRISDSMIVSNRFDVSAQNLSIAGTVDLRGTTWDNNLPNLVNLTIEDTGRLTLLGLSQFGTVAKPLDTFVNRGAIQTYSANINANNVDISGRIMSGQTISTLTINQFGGFTFTNIFVVDSGPISIQANASALLTGAQIQTLGDINLSGAVYKLDSSRITSGASLNLNIGSALLDSGPAANNFLTASNAFSMGTTVASGSLLGTTVTLEPPPRGTFRFRWSMPQPPSAATLTNIPTSASWVTDTNRTFATYSTNVPIGHLVLQTGTNTVFEFRGTTQNRALFVDLLDIQGTGITNLTTLTNQLKLIADASSSIDIYYADVICTNFERNVNLGFQNLAEFLNGKRLGGGTLHWVPTFNGPNTSDDVVVGASSTRMNRALRRSLVIDMDGDGIPNGRDDLPLSSGASTVRVADVSISSVDGKVGLKFQAFAGTYQVQFTDSLDKPVWRTAATYNHTSSTSQLVTVADPAPVTSDPRFYRLVYTAAQ